MKKDLLLQSWDFRMIIYTYNTLAAVIRVLAFSATSAEEADISVLWASGIRVAFAFDDPTIPIEEETIPLDNYRKKKTLKKP